MYNRFQFSYFKSEEKESVYPEQSLSLYSSEHTDWIIGLKMLEDS